MQIRRVFFALWPNEAARRAVARATRDPVQASGGRPVPRQNLHVTLLFVGSVAEERITELRAIGQEVAARCRFTEEGPVSLPATLTFDRVEPWHKARVLCATAAPESRSAGYVSPGAGPELAGKLAKLLHEMASASGFTLDALRFRPHVTVARKVNRAVQAHGIEALIWEFSDFALVESRTSPEGSVYSVIAAFPLR